jgi:hypothetical protein
VLSKERALLDKEVAVGDRVASSEVDDLGTSIPVLRDAPPRVILAYSGTGTGPVGDTQREAHVGQALMVADHLGDREVIDRVVKRLREIDRNSGIERTLAIGRLLLTQFFGDNPAIWRDRRRNKNNSIRRLAQRADCPLSRSALNDAVAVYVASHELKCVQTTGHITASHISVVLPLPSSAREEMLQAAEHGRWSVKQLKSNVATRRRADGERRGRPPRAASERVLSDMLRALQQLRRAVPLLSFDSLTRAEHNRYDQLMAEVSALGAELESLQESRGLSVSKVRHVVARGGDQTVGVVETG